MDERPMIHIRLPRPLLKQVDHAGIEMERDRARTIEHLLEMALETVGDQPEPALATGR